MAAGDDQEGSIPSPGPPAEERAANHAVDPERTLPGEDLESDSLEDAVLWASVYGELLDFKRSILTSSEDSARRMQPPARDEVARTDLIFLRAEADRFARRKAHWERRKADLRAR